MGIHHCRAVTHRGEYRCWPEDVLAAFALLLALLLTPGAGLGQDNSGYMEYHCTPDIKYECTVDQCKKITSDFQYAELFAYNTKTNELSACLWTNCYAARAIVFKDAISGTFTAIGRLMPSAHPGNEPIVVSLTIDVADTGVTSDAVAEKTSSFTAVWGYGKGLVFDMGRCGLQESL